MAHTELSGIGVWSNQLHYGDPSEAADAAAELEELGFSALWIPDVSGSVLDAVGHLLAATKRTIIATGILNLWMHEPDTVADSYAALTAAHGDRFLLGIGVSHAPLIDARQPGRYRQPLAATTAFLDGLDAAQRPVPVDRRVLAALGPKMLALAASRAAGAHPYLVTPEHTASARAALGDGPLLLPEQAVLLCDSRDEARAIGTDWLRAYLGLPNYANNLLRIGFSQDDLAQVSDRLFDAIIAWGDEAAILRRVAEHQAAGADHVCIQALVADHLSFPRDQWRRIAAAFRG
ncbi:LLM class F420-dependent oxidoreductase [Mycobacterium fragae]|uniref:LLM class F420-dependent oxidoreductase n=1 Tax=Mycobacterium fragae TaxID=1260918 RepID=A0A1X1V2S1_9MYCO|nr:LLM class F420-dependent oxidoreductase [Mycobacterium fragae]MCV7399848.1 LLM class F420-dependent oxidoreductase [Mycobacterium fragae]ORV63396.1 LLM class F420-dependent oxidoreductase [Mycobacterium fragae]